MAVPYGRFTRQFEFPGYAFQSTQTPVTFDHPNPYIITVPAGKAGSLTTRTDDNTGVATLSTGHGLATSDVVDVYWSGGVRYGMTATVATNAVTVDGGAGDVLPAQDTAVVLCEQVAVTCNIDGDNIELIGVLLKCDGDSAAKGHVDFLDSGNAQIHETDLVRYDQAGGFNHVADIANGDTNNYTGNPITQAKCSNGSSSAAIEIYILSGEDSTP